MNHRQRRTAIANVPDHHVVVVGAGFAGIGSAIKLREAGFTDFLLLEAGDGVGGTWHWNTYPGVAVDIPSFSYQFSFAQRVDWSRSYAKGEELKRYADDLIDRYDLHDHLRFNALVVRAIWDESMTAYRLELADGETLTARFLISAAGILTQPRLPDIPGASTFAGDTLHTARWDHSVELAGRRVAVIGTGASAIQVIPQIAPEVARLTVFQRTPIWCFPKLDVPLPAAARVALQVPGVRSAARLLSQSFVEVTFPLAAHYHRYFGLASRMEWWGKRWIQMQVEDPETAEKLTPQYGVGCKRPSFHNGYLATYNRENVSLETTAIQEITPTGVLTTDGVLHEIDVLILATGFKVMEVDNLPTFELVGAEGTSTADFFTENRLQAFHGVSLPGFPNYFMVAGPYGYNGASYFTLVELQVHHILRCLTKARADGADRVEVTQQANDEFFATMMRKRHRQVFWQDSCTLANSYYFDHNGDVPLRPTTTVESVWSSRRFPISAYQFSAERAS